jgi:hypothetical protein
MPMPVPMRSVNTHPRLMNWLCVLGIALLVLVLTSPTMAEKGKLRERLTPEVMAVVYPDADRLGPEEGTPPAIAVYKGDKMVAYVFSTLDIVAATGYSTTPHHRREGGVPQRELHRSRHCTPAPAQHLPGARDWPAAARRRP